ncbi:MAG: class I SAM-dependent methyltransferase [Acidiferrobacterales bacterium]
MRRPDRVATEDSVTSEYARLAARYDTRWSRYLSATINETLSRLPKNPPLRVLDVACGTGALLMPLVAKYPNASLTGIDLTPEMLEIARRKLPERIILVCAKAENLPFPAQYFDLVISANSFHYFHDPRRALSEFHRVLAPLGALVITDWCDDFIFCKVCDLFLRLFNRAHSRTYRREECKNLLECSAFEAVHVASYKVSWLWGLMTAQARRRGVT